MQDFKIPQEDVARGCADAVLKLMAVIGMASVQEPERPGLTKAAVKWFLNLASHMGIEDAHVQAEFLNTEEGGTTCVYTPLNESARFVKDYLLQCELSRELDKG